MSIDVGGKEVLIASRPSLQAYILSALIAGLALLLTLLLEPLMRLGYSIFFLPAVVISAWYGGLRAGLLTTLLSIIGLSYFFIPPTHSILINELNGLAWLTFFVLVSFWISSLSDIRRKAEESLSLANRELEKRVIERTAELTRTNQDLQAEVIERQRIAVEKESLIGELKGALDQIKVLRGLLPICTLCKKIRDDKGFWKQFESYICEHSDVKFSNSICPECAKVVYPKYPFVEENA